MGAEGDDVGAPDRVLEALDRVSPGIERGQPPRAVWRPGGDPDLLEVAHPGHDLEMGVSLDARADDGQHLRVLACEVPGGNRSGARGANRGDPSAVHHGDRRAGRRVEQSDQRLV